MDQDVNSLLCVPYYIKVNFQNNGIINLFHLIKDVNWWKLRQLMPIVRGEMIQNGADKHQLCSRIVDEIKDALRPGIVCPWDELKLTSTKKFKSTGFDKIDKLLGGGIGRGEIIEIYGRPNTGKTEFCYDLLAHFCFRVKAKRVGTALYLDFKNDFKPFRLFELCNCYKSALTRVKVLNGNNFESIHEIMDQVSDELSEEPSLFTKHLDIIIIDSLPLLFYPIGTHDKKKWEIALDRFTRLLKRVSFLYGIVIVYVNNGVTILDRGKKHTRKLGVKPALGQMCSSVPNIRFLFSRTDRNKKTTFKATLKKSTRVGGLNESVEFTIHDSGIKLL